MRDKPPVLQVISQGGGEGAEQGHGGGTPQEEAEALLEGFSYAEATGLPEAAGGLVAVAEIRGVVVEAIQTEG